MRKPNADSLRTAIKAPNNAMFSNLSTIDVETLVLLVMQAAQADAEADIKNMLAEMQKNNKKKEALHDEEQRIKSAAQTAAYADIKNMTAGMEKTRQQKDALSKEATQINATQSKTRDSSKTKIPVYNIDQEKRLAKIKDEKDALSEQAAQDMLMLQQLMEKKNQLEQMISNIMKAQGDSLNTLSNNLKAS
jgi:hypothetical protein